MTVSVPAQLVYDFNADGVTTTFSYPVRFLGNDELNVILIDGDGIETTQELTVDYTVSAGPWPTGGDVIFNSAPDSGLTVRIYRDTTWEQIVDLEDKTRNPAQAVENQLDRLTMAGQDVRRVARDFTLSLTELNNAVERAESAEEGAVTAEEDAETARDFAARWASDPEDGPPIDDGVNPPNQSAYHWAMKASENALGDMLKATYDPANIQGNAFNGIPVATISALSALDTSQFSLAHLTDGVPNAYGRFGTFKFDSSDLSAMVSADTFEAIYIAPDSDPTGASGAWVRVFSGPELLTSWFGAVGDGVTDAGPAINAAIEFAATYGPKVVVIPSASDKYVLNTTLAAKSNVHVRAYGAEFTGDGTLLEVTGTVETAVAIANGNYRSGDLYVDVATASFAPGDTVMLQSQRNSISYADCGLDWTLGYGTPSVPAAFFYEWHEVHALATGGTGSAGANGRVRLAGYIVFPTYSDTNSSETYADAPASATVQKVNALKGFRWSGGKFYREGHDTSLILCTYADDVLFRDMEFWLDGVTNCNTAGRILLSRNVRFEDCKSEYSALTSHAPTPQYLYGHFGFIATQNCGVRRCQLYHGGQSVDFTFGSGTLAYTTLYGFVDDCDFYYDRINTALTHGGGYGWRCTNNRMHSVYRGIVCRHRAAIITGNVITGGGNDLYTSQAAQAYGISMQEGWAVDSEISGNVVSNFYRGIAFIDAPDADESFRFFNSSIVGNTVNQCWHGITTVRSTNGTTLTDKRLAMLTIERNRINGFFEHAIYIPYYTPGVSILRNTIRGTPGVTHIDAIKVDTHSHVVDISYNKIGEIETRTGYAILAASASSDQGFTVLNSSRMVGNVFDGSGNAFSGHSSHFNRGSDYDINGSFDVNGNKVV